MPLVTVAEVQTLLNLGADDMGGRLPGLTDAASAMVEGHLNRWLPKQQYTQVCSGGREIMPLKGYPVETVSAVTLEDAPVTGWLLDGAVGLLLRPGYQPWPAVPGGYRVTYTGGLDPVPQPVKYACAILVAVLADAANNKGQQITSERLSDYQVTYARSDGAVGLEALSAAAAALLAPYRNRLY